MDSDPNRRRRRSLRLSGYDYAQTGAYFITLNIQDRATILGAVVDGVIQLSEIGKIVAEEWEQTPTIRPNIRLDSYVVMPDHLHGILIITERDPAAPTWNAAILRSPARTIGAIVRGFKAAVVRRVGAPIWQRNYYEHIIRSDEDLERIRRYIAENPARWAASQELP